MALIKQDGNEKWLLKIGHFFIVERKHVLIRRVREAC
jgi:hypothetical protein